MLSIFSKSFWKRNKDSENTKENLPEEKSDGLAAEPEHPGKSPQDEERIWFRRLLSHNIRMPMTIIAGYGDLLKNHSLKTREDELQCIEKICKNIDYLNTLFKVLVDDGHNEELLGSREWFDLLQCAREAFDYVSSMTSKANIAISVNSRRESVMYYGNRIIMMRAFYNLIENSIRYMNRPGNICLTVEETVEEIYAIYRDDGEGMDETEADSITDLNYQGSNANRDGHGIGMYLVKDAVETNGGTLFIRTGKGKGMAVYMAFPKSPV